ncbi:DUF2157 domain-containing protein [Vibrio europaeus]|uniref:DUF2157 domain-containing protein n=1 Tax=Vibrio europaeus TaxID=300876 RepID=UPI00233E6D9A|nr:DUF2157 domain-containing protein [Vibrio europaeus]MDC5821379.1 DUF2157 domain-containing protein [Vibrio europaeus]MDC5868377.1 DUF2157 domain-containing protein [Vibrio europaeus]
MNYFRNSLIHLIERGCIKPEQLDKTLEVSGVKASKSAWVGFINRLMLWGSCAAFVLAAIFFLAHNWSEIGRLSKFALVELLLVVVGVTYVKNPVGSLASNACLILLSILLGALLALFGQTYQSGADTWQLFFTWAMLISPWVLVARILLLWAIWFSLLNVALIQFFNVNSGGFTRAFGIENSAIWALFVFNSISFSIWYKLSKSRVWMQPQWLVRLLAVAVGSPITVLMTWAIFDNELTSTPTLLVWGLFLALFYFFYRKLQTDLFMLAGCCLSVVIVTTMFVANLLADVGPTISYLALFVVVVTVGGGAVSWLRRVQKEFCA